MFSVDDYIQNLLRTSNYQPTLDDQNKLKCLGLESWILSKLMSKKFRKTKAEAECIERTKLAVKRAVSRNLPLPVYFFQGAYKLWRLPSSPEADWAEFFNISYLLEYVAPIANIYKPGLNLVYYMHTLLMEAHDNLTTKEINDYINSFNKLIKIFRSYCPSNISIEILKDADIYPREEYFEELEHGLKQAITIYESFPEDKKNDFIRMSKLNIKWKGKERWDLLLENEKQEKIYKSALY